MGFLFPVFFSLAGLVGWMELEENGDRECGGDGAARFCGGLMHANVTISLLSFMPMPIKVSLEQRGNTKK